jgi:putative restriction endonuclease
MEFGPRRQSYHPEYPFWRLQNDDLWELTNAEELETRRGNTDAKKTELLEHKVAGGFPPEIQEQSIRFPRQRLLR